MLEMLGSRIAVIPVEDPDRVGSLWIPAEGKQRVDQGVVKYRGPDVVSIRVGDVVLFGGYTGTKISIEGEGELIVMKEEDVHAVVEGTGEQVFSLSQCLQLIETHHTEWLKKTNFEAAVTVEPYIEELKDRFRDFLYSEALEF